MPSLEFKDLRIDVGFSGDFHIRIRSLDVHANKEQIAEMIYPVLDAREKAQAAAAGAGLPSSADMDVAAAEKQSAEVTGDPPSSGG